MPIDYSKYPPNWKSEIVPRILKRANNKCEFCGLKNHTYVFSGKIYTRQAEGRYSWRTLWFHCESDYFRASSIITDDGLKKVVLTIAHLDHDETNHDVKDGRLKALCQMCHLNYDAKEKFRRACQK